MSLDDLMGNPVSVRVSEVIQETDTAFTIIFNVKNASFSFSPGQFLMIWIQVLK